MAEPQFGGPWTEDKLSRLRKYLQAYMTIFSTNRNAKFLKTIYLDAFAGAGLRKQSSVQMSEEDFLFKANADSDSEALLKGSTQVALETSPSFAEYVLSKTTKNILKRCLSYDDDFQN